MSNAESAQPAVRLDLGTVQTLRRYPVKSMLGASIASAVISPSGVDHDRVLALIDSQTGRVASAKQPRLWRTLLQCTATWDGGDAITIALPDGRTVTSADPDIDEVLSGVVGRAVRLCHDRPAEAIIERPDPEDVMDAGEDAEVAYRLLQIGDNEPGGTFVDDAPVSLVTTSTLDRVGYEAVRYRPNVVIDATAGAEPFAENDWTGREIRVGEVLLRGLKPIVRCAIPTVEHGSLPRAVGAVRTLLTLNRITRPNGSVGPCLGAYAEVLRPGTIRPGDPVALA